MRVNPDGMPGGGTVAMGTAISIRHQESIISLSAGVSTETVADLVKALNRHV